MFENSNIVFWIFSVVINPEFVYLVVKHIFYCFIPSSGGQILNGLYLQVDRSIWIQAEDACSVD